VAIGFLLGTVAVLLARENLGLLVGESAAPQIVDEIHALIQRDSRVRHAERPKTMQLSPGSLLVNVRLAFEPATTKSEMLETIDELTAAIRQAHPSAELIMLQPTSVQDDRDAAASRRSSA
jgi:divalent metal cation (Fe/Co/Zn/Cd) transporter